MGLNVFLNSGHYAIALAAILAGPEAEMRAPVSIGHIQWLDMSDRAARQAANTATFVEQP